jgi:hypothetical protein
VIAPKVAASLLASAVVLMGGAWQLQNSAAHDLAGAREAHGREVANDDSSAPDPKDYEAILATLEHSIEIRQAIEVQLEAIESSVAALGGRQAEASQTAATAREELVRIASALGGAAEASDASLKRVAILEDRLQISARLARLIAKELAELDHKLGPTAGGRP